MLPILRRFAGAAAEELGFAPDDVIKIEMAVDEACSNIILHAYAHGVTGPQVIDLRLDTRGEALAISIRDRGRGRPAPADGGTLADYHTLDRANYHGLGTLIIRQFMDEVRYEAEPGQGTSVTMIKHLRPPLGRPDFSSARPVTC